MGSGVSIRFEVASVPTVSSRAAHPSPGRVSIRFEVASVPTVFSVAEESVNILFQSALKSRLSLQYEDPSYRSWRRSFNPL